MQNSSTSYARKLSKLTCTSSYAGKYDPKRSLVNWQEGHKCSIVVMWAYVTFRQSLSIPWIDKESGMHCSLFDERWPFVKPCRFRISMSDTPHIAMVSGFDTRLTCTSSYAGKYSPKRSLVSPLVSQLTYLTRQYYVTSDHPTDRSTSPSHHHTTLLSTRPPDIHSAVNSNNQTIKYWTPDCCWNAWDQP